MKKTGKKTRILVVAPMVNGINLRNSFIQWLENTYGIMRKVECGLYLQAYNIIPSPRYLTTER